MLPANLGNANCYALLYTNILAVLQSAALIFYRYPTLRNMPDISRNRALAYLHIAVLLWGFTAILGKLISYGSFLLVWQRMSLTSLVYLALPVVWKSLARLSWRQIRIFLGIGLVVCAHWITFYGSIKLGNSASVTLACLSAASFFASLMEPWLLRKPVSKKDLVLGAIVIGGILLIYGTQIAEQAAEFQHLNGSGFGAAVISGLLSAALAALFTVLNKKYIEEADAWAISTLEMVSGATALSLLMPLWLKPEDSLLPQMASDWIWTLLLALLCTNLTFWLGTRALSQLSAFTANLTVNLEPVYGIVLGALIFHENEDLNSWFYVGTAVILGAIFASPLIDQYQKRKGISRP